MDLEALCVYCVICEPLKKNENNKIMQNIFVFFLFESTADWTSPWRSTVLWMRCLSRRRGYLIPSIKALSNQKKDPQTHAGGGHTLKSVSAPRVLQTFYKVLKQTSYRALRLFHPESRSKSKAKRTKTDLLPSLCLLLFRLLILLETGGKACLVIVVSPNSPNSPN